MRTARALLAGAALVSLVACTSTRQVADSGFQPPQGDYRMIVLQPDISVGLLTAGGMVEPREDWTEQARVNVLKALDEMHAARGGGTKVARTREEAGWDTARIADLVRLHEVVGASIALHKYLGATLPSKKDRFDWTLGGDAVEFGRATRFDFALFLHARDSFSSGGRAALQVAGFLGCAVGVCVLPAGGQQSAYASLVDLGTGQVVWFNTLASTVGDIRTPEGAEKMVKALLGNMKAGKLPAARSAT